MISGQWSPIREEAAGGAASTNAESQLVRSLCHAMPKNI